MTNGSGASGLATLSICEALLLALTENGIITPVEATALLTDAAATHHDAARLRQGNVQEHKTAAALIEAIRASVVSVRAERVDRLAPKRNGRAQSSLEVTHE